MNSSIGFIFYLTEGKSTYIFEIIGSEQIDYYTFDSNASCSFYYDNPDSPGSVTITHLDTLNKIASGTFEMDLINHDCDKTLMLVRQGRFDVRF